MIYNVNGETFSPAYNVSGENIIAAYNVSGNQVFPNGKLLKVMTYNVGGWYIGSGANVPTTYDSQYYALQNAIIGGQNADILCIEEYWNNFSSNRTARSLLEQYYPYIEARNGNTTYFGRAICSKYPITSYTQHLFTGEAKRYYDTATINVDGTSVSVLVTHLGLTTEERVTQAAELRTYIETLDNVILCGDFNTAYAMGTSGEDSEEYTTVWLPFINAGYHLANCSDENGFHGTYWKYGQSKWLNLDNIVTSANISILSVSTDQTKVTNPVSADPNWIRDHIPLVAEIAVGGS